MRILLDAAAVREGVVRLAREIAAEYGERPLTILGVMTGSLVLLADLIRLLEMPLRVGVLQASSYRRGTTRGELTIQDSMMPDVVGREVLVIDDIFDTGHTLAEVAARLASLGPKSLRTAVLLRKTGRQEVRFEPDFAVFSIPNEFVVGYGLDYQDAFRNLPHIAVLEPHDLEKVADS